MNNLIGWLKFVLQAEALRYGEGVGEVDPDDGDTLSNCADNRRMSIEVGDNTPC